MLSGPWVSHPEFSNFNKNHLEGSLECRFLAPILTVKGGFAFFPRFQIIQLVLAQGPHFENQCPMSVRPLRLSDK